MSKKLKVGDRLLKVIERPNDHEEAVIVEISPDSKWVKYLNKHRSAYWCEVKDFKVITYLEIQSGGE